MEFRRVVSSPPGLTNWHARGDSGAILVGAGSADICHDRLLYSTYGSRVDMQGWGEKVTTLGRSNFQSSYDLNPDPTGDIRQAYTTYFDGTSSAGAMVAGAAAALQSLAQYRPSPLNVRLTPGEMRDLLKNTGIPQGQRGLPENIGPFPDLGAAALALGYGTDLDANNVPDQCESPPEPSGCDAVVAVGGRYLEVTPSNVAGLGPDSFALRVAGKFTGSFCFGGLFLQSDGTLGPSCPEFTAAQWGTVLVHGEGIAPTVCSDGLIMLSYQFEIITNTSSGCPGTSKAPSLGNPVNMWYWGDCDNSGAVDVTDIAGVMNASLGDFSICTLHGADVAPCDPNGVVNMQDIDAVIAAFNGVDYNGYFPNCAHCEP